MGSYRTSLHSNTQEVDTKVTPASAALWATPGSDPQKQDIKRVENKQRQQVAALGLRSDFSGSELPKRPISKFLVTALFASYREIPRLPCLHVISIDISKIWLLNGAKNTEIFPREFCGVTASLKHEQKLVHHTLMWVCARDPSDCRSHNHRGEACREGTGDTPKVRRNSSRVRTPTV